MVSVEWWPAGLPLRWLLRGSSGAKGRGEHVSVELDLDNATAGLPVPCLGSSGCVGIPAVLPLDSTPFRSTCRMKL